jgi:hypothetical protein
MMKVYTPLELNRMTDDERKAALAGGMGQMFSEMANRHVTWIWWTRDTSEMTDILGHGTAFILDRGTGPMLVTAAHVYREYLAHQRQHGTLYCQVANTRVRDLSKLLIACGNLHVPLGDNGPDADIATFQMTPAAVQRVNKTPILALGDWPPPPVPNQNVMFAGYPGHERVFVSPNEINFGFHTGMTGVRTVTDRQITLLIQREFLLDWTGNGVPRPGYGLGGISGAPLLAPEFGASGWYFRLVGVVSEAPDARPAEDVLFEMVAADRANFILPDGKLAKVL